MDDQPAPQPAPAAAQDAQQQPGEGETPGGAEERRQRAPQRVKRLSLDELRALATETDRLRLAWEDQVARRVNEVLAVERDAVLERWAGAGSEAVVATAVRGNAPAWVALLSAVYLEAGRFFGEREYARLAPKRGTGPREAKQFDPAVI